MAANVQDLDDDIKILTEFSENVVGGSLGKESCTNLWNSYQVKICSDDAQTQERHTKLTHIFENWTGNVSEFSETFSFL